MNPNQIELKPAKSKIDQMLPYPSISQPPSNHRGQAVSTPPHSVHTGQNSAGQDSAMHQQEQGQTVSEMTPSMKHGGPHIAPFPSIRNSVMSGTINPAFLNSGYMPNAYNTSSQRSASISQPQMLPPNQAQMLYSNQQQGYQQHHFAAPSSQLLTPSLQSKQKSKSFSKNPVTPAYTGPQPTLQTKLEESSLVSRSNRKKRANPPKREFAEVDDGSLPTNDETDSISAHDISIARYKKYHDYVASLFSPLHSSVLKRDSIFSNLNKDVYTERVAKNQQELEYLKVENEKRIERIENDRKEYLSFMKDLESADTTDGALINKRIFEVFGKVISGKSQSHHKIENPETQKDLPSEPLFMSL